MSDWESRMSARMHARPAAELAPEMTVPTHLHGTATACPCGALDGGIACVALVDGALPDRCPECGKPWFDVDPDVQWREVPVHALGCRAVEARRDDPG